MFVKLGKMFLLSETASIHLVHCSVGAGEKKTPGDIRQTSKALEKGRLQAGLDILGAVPQGVPY